ncbi:MAG: DUF177 domain-containing protein [Candidatus Sericytochromatia bacterium]|nr:DUF177 domain-containing protein [Candidatus Sericytochromatia bacterium]
MQISITSILQDPDSVTRYDFSESMAAPEEGEQFLEPVSGELAVERISDRLLQVSGTFQTVLKSNCDRCGEMFTLPARFTLDEALEVVDSEPLSFEVEESVLATGYLDASDLVRQTLILSLPPRRLCGCEPQTSVVDTKTVDPRWAALGAFPLDTN